MDLELVEQAGRERELCDRCAMDQDVFVARGPLGFADRALDVGYVHDPMARYFTKLRRGEHGIRLQPGGRPTL